MDTLAPRCHTMGTWLLHHHKWTERNTFRWARRRRALSFQIVMKRQIECTFHIQIFPNSLRSAVCASRYGLVHVGIGTYCDQASYHDDSQSYWSKFREWVRWVLWHRHLQVFDLVHRNYWQLWTFVVDNKSPAGHRLVLSLPWYGSTTISSHLTGYSSPLAFRLLIRTPTLAPVSSTWSHPFQTFPRVSLRDPHRRSILPRCTSQHLHSS